MANIASSKKDARRSAVRAQRNRSVKSAVKTSVTKVRRAVHDPGTEDVQDAAALAMAAISVLDRAAAKGILHANNAARRKSRLMRLVSGAASGKTAATPAKGTGKTAAQKAAVAKTTAARKPATPKAAPAKKAVVRKAPAKK